jgi:hypothetical protein
MHVNGYKVLLLAAVGTDQFLLLGQNDREYVVALKDETANWWYQGYYTADRSVAFKKFWERHADLSE